MHAALRRLSCLAVGLALCLSAALANAPEDQRVALVIGNAAYPGDAALLNPVRDAAAMAGTLRSLGFTVIELRDAGREPMRQAIDQTRRLLAGRKGVGMLYYAGHGLQLDWRNFMVPVDARLAVSEDIPRQAIDVGTVIAAFREAGNRLNIVVLDACRDNPFTRQGSVKGLSPLDAPPGTYLAYATAPGNVAEDGDPQAGNGLFTRFLLQELRKPARIEDVFKRVRLSVRRESEGRQVPWDSSSLEDDFWFNDGERFTFRADDLEREAAQTRERLEGLRREAERLRERERVLAAEQALAAARQAEARRERELQFAREQAELERRKKHSEDAREQAFAAEKADWDRIRDSRSADDFYNFLLKYPTGYISEQARFALERLQAPRIVAQALPGAPVQQPGQPRFRVGDAWESRTVDNRAGGELLVSRNRVVRLEDGLARVEGTQGVSLFTLDGGAREIRGPTFHHVYDPPRLDLPGDEYVVGRRWTSRSWQTNERGRRILLESDFRVMALEDITIPAGRFKAWRIRMTAGLPNGGRVELTYWTLPDWGQKLKLIRQTWDRRGQPVQDETLELIEISRAPG